MILMTMQIRSLTMWLQKIKFLRCYFVWVTDEICYHWVCAAPFFFFSLLLSAYGSSITTGKWASRASPSLFFFQVALGSINVISGIDFHLLFSVKLLPLIKIWISLGLVLWPSSFVTLSIYYLSEMQFSFISKLDYLQVCCENQIRWWERA